MTDPNFPIFNKIQENSLAESDIKKIVGASVFYVGSRLDSFRRFMDLMRERVVVPISNELEKDSAIGKKIQKALEGTSRIEDFLNEKGA